MFPISLGSTFTLLDFSLRLLSLVIHHRFTAAAAAAAATFICQTFHYSAPTTANSAFSERELSPVDPSVCRL